MDDLSVFIGRSHVRLTNKPFRLTNCAVRFTDRYGTVRRTRDELETNSRQYHIYKLI
jgi:hypothetical protein